MKPYSAIRRAGGLMVTGGFHAEREKCPLAVNGRTVSFLSVAHNPAAW